MLYFHEAELSPKTENRGSRGTYTLSPWDDDYMLCGENKGVGPSGHLIDCHESSCKKELLALAKGHEKWNN